jgi:hypothetical protein
MLHGSVGILVLIQRWKYISESVVVNRYIGMHTDIHDVSETYRGNEELTQVFHCYQQTSSGSIVWLRIQRGLERPAEAGVGQLDVREQSRHVRHALGL